MKKVKLKKNLLERKFHVIWYNCEKSTCQEYIEFIFTGKFVRLQITLHLKEDRYEQEDKLRYNHISALRGRLAHNRQNRRHANINATIKELHKPVMGYNRLARNK